MERFFEVVYNKLTKRGIKLKINVMDNEASASIKQWLVKQNTVHQLPLPQNCHRCGKGVTDGQSSHYYRHMHH